MQGGDVQGVVDGKLCGQARTIILCAAKHNATVNIESGNTPGYTEGQTLKARRQRRSRGLRRPGATIHAYFHFQTISMRF